MAKPEPHQPFEVECDGCHVGFDTKAREAKVATSPETVVLLGFSKLALNLVSLIQAGLVSILGHKLQPDLFARADQCL